MGKKSNHRHFIPYDTKRSDNEKYHRRYQGTSTDRVNGGGKEEVVVGSQLKLYSKKKSRVTSLQCH